MQASSIPIVLLADVNVRRRSLLRRLLEGCAATVDCNTVADLVFKTRAGDIDAIVLGSLADDRSSSSLEALRRLRPEKISTVVFIADQSSEDLAIGALQAGVRYYFKNPICLEEVARTVLGLLPQQKVHSGLDCIVGDSGGMRRVRELIQCFGKTEATVLITGETGTGKELIAANIHRTSSRADAPMITVNSSAIPESLVESELFGFEKGAFTGAVTPQKGKFALAHGGTIFLDEIGDMSRLAQAKILRALESGEIQPLGAKKTTSVDVRVIAATHQDVEALVAEDKFRPDLYFRLNVARIHVPPLRERLEDLPKLVEHIVGQFRQKWGRSVAGATNGALALLCNHDWPGNVRELRNILESAFWLSTSGQINTSDLPLLHRVRSAPTPMARKTKSTALPSWQKSSERDDLVRILTATNWNKSQTAELMKLSRMTVYRKINQYGLQSDAASSTAYSRLKLPAH